MYRKPSCHFDFDAPTDDRKWSTSVRICWPSLIIIERKNKQYKWNSSVAIGTDSRNHRYGVTIDTKALFYLTNYSPYAANCCWLQPPEWRSVPPPNTFNCSTPHLCSTWIWSGTLVAWSRCGWLCSWLAGAGERRHGSPRHISTGVCSSWRWPAGTQTCAPVPGPFDSQKTNHCQFP